MVVCVLHIVRPLRDPRFGRRGKPTFAIGLTGSTTGGMPKQTGVQELGFAGSITSSGHSMKTQATADEPP